MIADTLCPMCAKETRDVFPRNNPERGGFVRFVEGRARRPLPCYQCQAEIPAGEAAVAFSVYTTERPWTPWESEYLEIDGETSERIA